MKKPKHMQKQFIVIGLGRFGRSIARTLCENGAQVLGIDRKQAMVEEMANDLTQCICADACDRDVLRTLNVSDFSTAIVTTASDIKSSCIAVMMLKELGVNEVIAKAADEFHGSMLKKLGADKILFPERDMGRRAAHNILSGRMLDYLEIADDFGMFEMEPQEDWVGKTLSQLELRKRYGLNVLAIRRADKTILPHPDTVFETDDHILFIAASEKIAKLDQMD